MRSHSTTTGLIFFFTTVFIFSCCSATEQLVTEDGVGIEVSSAPNPAWTAEKLLDGGFGPAEGWLALADGEAPWLRVTFPKPRPFSGLIFYQVSFSEAGQKRYSRPMRLSVNFDGGKPWTITLHDLEGKPQMWKFLPGSVSSMKITIDKSYSDARYPKYTGFQEIVFMEGADTGPPGAALVKSASPPAEDSPKMPAMAGAGDSAGPVSGATLQEDEKELLRLLDEFYRKFETYILKKAKEKGADGK